MKVSTRRGLLRFGLYLSAVLVPLIIGLLVQPRGSLSVTYEMGKGFALTGLMILLLQLLLAARIKWIERAFGFDILIRFHKYIIIAGVALLAVHPVLLSLGGYGWGLLFAANVPWFVWLGRAGLVLLAANVAFSYAQFRAGVKFETWRAIHNTFALSLVAVLFLHGWFTGSDLREPAFQVWWIAAFAAAVGFYTWHKAVRPLRLRSRAWMVKEVREEMEGVWTVKMVPPFRKAMFDYTPGQFQFITFLRDRDLPTEEHHWTISSSPTEKGHVTSTIKALGDFTSTMGATRPGDRAKIDAPFGRFSCLFHPEEKTLGFIIGGIGITPVRSMLRYLHDTKQNIPVVLLYGSKTEDRILFKEELDQIAESGFPELKIVHVIENPTGDWEGESGLITKKMIRKYCGPVLLSRGYYVAGPPGMLEATIQNLRKLDIPDERIHLEIFSFAG